MSQAALAWDLRLDRAPRLTRIELSRHATETSSGSGGLAEWRLHFHKQEATLLLGDACLELTPGSCLLLPPGVEHEYRPRCDSEYLRASFTLPDTTGDAVRVAALQDLGRDFTGLSERLEHAMHVFGTRPAQAEARLWDVLWELSERSNRGKPRPSRRHSALEQACRVVQSRLSERLSLSDLAAPAGVSPAHLTRLFRIELGLTATDYLRRCRMERALHLLTRSEVPVKEVACEVGIPDLHAFNKAVRRGFGVSPRELRARGGLGLVPFLGEAARDRGELPASGRSASPSFHDPGFISDRELLAPKSADADPARA